MSFQFYRNSIFFALFFCSACESNSNKRAADVEDLDKVIAEDKKAAPPAPTRNALTATEFIALFGCKDLPCVQLFMKDRSSDFVHAKKGEFASQHRSVVQDTTGAELVMPLSTLYVSVDPGADWRMVHTLHTKALSDQLLKEFDKAKFLVTDSTRKNGNAGPVYQYRSVLYPGLVLLFKKTFSPWRARGLYYKVTWPCYVFELKEGE